MSKALAMVRRHLNSHNPTIRRIPPEILIMIASHLKADAAFITKTTHVCHHWRVTLLSCPDLWTYPDFTRGSHWALSFLNRSKSFPIHVDLTKAFPSNFLVDLLCQHATRVDTLKISRFDGFQELFRRPMASLKTLEVVTPDSWLFAYNIRPAIREFPALTSLTVKHNPGALAFRGALITHLRVSISGLSLEVIHLASLLQSCVLLERLEIENKGELESGLRLLPDELIPLPHLRSFTQTLHWDRHVAGIINQLDLPPSCPIVLRCIAGPTNGCPSLDLPGLRDATYFTNLKRLKVVHTGGYLGSEAGFTLDFINDKGTRFTATIEFINFAVSQLDKDREHPKDDRIEASMPGIEVLCVDGNRYVPMENCSSLTTLILSGAIVHLYLDSLMESGGRIAYKNLHTLVLSFVSGQFKPNPVDFLSEIAQTRAQAGLPLRTIIVACPPELTFHDVDALKELGAYVERVELLFEDDMLDWSLDKYFLN